MAGSFLPAAAGALGGASNFGGGIIFGSFAGSTSGAGFVQLSALGMLSQFYGTGNLGVNTSGYRVIPFAFMDYSGDAISAEIGYTLSATQALASIDSIVIVAPKRFAISQGLVTSVSNISVHFMYVALIVSNPG